MGKFLPGNTIGHRFKPGDPRPAGAGRPPKLKKLPKNAREKITEALFHVLTLPDKETAAAYLQKTAEELPEFGFLIQAYARGILGKNSIAYLSDILDRVGGKPRQVVEASVEGKVEGFQIIVEDLEAKEDLKAAIDANKGQ